MIMKRTARASMAFFLKWRSSFAAHSDRFFAERIDFWRDIFPGILGKQIFALYAGDNYRESFSPGVLVPPFEEKKIIAFDNKLFESSRGEFSVIPRLGRYYPQGFAWRALNCYQGNLRPFRVIRIENQTILADTNHPLANYPLTLEAACIEPLGFAEARGGSCNVVAELVCENGPGMQAPLPDVPTDFYSEYPFRRRNEADDSVYYGVPRMVRHLDDTAIGQIQALFGRLLPSGAAILDLMSSWESHLPDTIKDVHVTGLGLNEDELRANPKLSDFRVHDLNRRPVLPFEDDAFDAAICAASIEYLVQPIEVIKEVARVLKPGAKFVTVFSDRWFPGKEILPWSEMHPFERMGLVLDFYLQSHAFESLHTESVRGLPRPQGDKYFGKMGFSDPIFAIWGSTGK